MTIFKEGTPIGELDVESMELKTDSPGLKTLVDNITANGFDEPTGGEKDGGIYYCQQRVELGPETVGLLAMALEEAGYEVDL